MKSKLKLILLVTTINLNCVSYFSNFCKVAEGKNTSKKRICTFYKTGKKLFGEVGETLGIAIDVGVNGNRIVNKKPKKNTKYKDTELEIDSKYTGNKNNSKQKKETNKLNKNK